MSEKIQVALLGSTGSIGTQTLDVVSNHPDLFEMAVLTANKNADLLIEQALLFKPNCVVISDESKFEQVRDALWDAEIKVFTGEKALEEVVEMQEVDIVLTALVGFAGLKPTISAIKAGKNIALANKETLVVAGEIITALAAEHKVNIYPVDSEHSAIFQCLVGEFHNPIEKIYITASGGPFRGKKAEELANITKEQALKHPNWEMGAKITIDSATLMNKGLEVIEAKWLFKLKDEQIDVIVHPQSIVHSIVQFKDGSMKAQMGLPDMKLPIQYALTFPNRLETDFPRFNFLDYPSLTFEKADMETFTNLKLAYYVMKKGGNLPAVLNAANEITVAAFLEDKIKFLDISKINKKVVEEFEWIKNPTLENLFETDILTRQVTAEMIAKG
ncbi:1-deoxy-D-xylulose-5-phosphate reductoisomerase [Crocinitomix catalasitica]|uniref:1-deoxy-D-xylulose-5-phosphate reductoisomerase n=1 Tax=Crocinitomix catalasitica TaxID=184607 RepID=UPI00047FEEA1|nr:1-deoxy-D-xylulose-5-phosphate reductoisomerase [Crocinitomix catalasitica]